MGTPATDPAPEQLFCEAAAHAEVASIGELRSQSNAITDTIFDRIRDLSRPLALSLQRSTAELRLREWAVAFDPNDPGVWGDPSGSFLNNDTAMGYNGTSVVALAGVDTIIAKRWIAGFSAGYTHADLGFRSLSGDRLSNGAVFGPYAAYIFAPHWSLDGLFNYTRLSNSISTTFPGPSDSFGSNRLIGAVNLDFYADKGPFKLTGFGGYSYSWEGADNNLFSATPPFTNNIRYGAVKLGGEAGYRTGRFEFYLPLTLEYETTKPRDGSSRTALVVGIGLRYQWTKAIKLGLVAKTTQIKTHTRDVIISGNFRVSF